jgi:hypothetical protein
MPSQWYERYRIQPILQPHHRQWVCSSSIQNWTQSATSAHPTPKSNVSGGWSPHTSSRWFLQPRHNLPGAHLYSYSTIPRVLFSTLHAVKALWHRSVIPSVQSCLFILSALWILYVKYWYGLWSTTVTTGAWRLRIWIFCEFLSLPASFPVSLLVKIWVNFSLLTSMLFLCKDTSAVYGDTVTSTAAMSQVKNAYFSLCIYIFHM